MTSAMTSTVDWIPAVLHAQTLQGWPAPVGFRAHLNQVSRGEMTPEQLIYRSADECRQAASRSRVRTRPFLKRIRRKETDYEDSRYPVLRNLADIQAPGALRTFESEASATRMLAFLGNIRHSQGTRARLGRITTTEQIKVVHRYLFGDVFSWAGSLRTIDISRGGQNFIDVADVRSELDTATAALVRHYSAEKDPVTGIDPEPLAEFLARYHWAHPFRDGNGRTAAAVILSVTGPKGLLRITPDEWFAATTNSLGHPGQADPGPWLPVVKKILW